MITHAEVLLGIENPMCRPEVNPCATGPDYLQQARALISQPPVTVKALIDMAALLMRNGVAGPQKAYLSPALWASLLDDPACSALFRGERAQPDFRGEMSISAFGLVLVVGAEELSPERV